MALPTQQIGGLVSGFDTANIIEQLMTIERRPVRTLENRKLEHQTKLEAYRGVNNLLLEFQNSVNSISSNEIWNVKNATSTNESILAATAGEFASPGSYQFRAGRLAQTAQYMSGGFADRASSPVSPAASGEIRIDSAKSRVDSGTLLSVLNGGQGVYHGKIKITDRAGNAAVVDLSTAVTVEDVINAINSADGIKVTAGVNRWQSGQAWNPPYGDALAITDISGGAGSLTVENYGGGTTAEDLGIDGSTAGSILTGSSIYSLTGLTPLASLRDGLGINDGAAGTIAIYDDSLAAALQNSVFGATQLDDLNNGSGVNGGVQGKLTLNDASTNGGANFEVDLNGVSTIDGVITRINNTISATDPDSTLRATLASDSKGLAFENADNLTVTGTGTTEDDLGLGGITFNGTQDGNDLDPVRREDIALDTILHTINGGAGVNGGTPGSITISDANVNGGVAFDVDLSDAATIGDVVTAINDAIAAVDPAATLEAGIAAGGGGLHFENADTLTIDNTGGAGTTAQDLGIQFIAPEAGPDAFGTNIAPTNLALEIDLSDAKTVQSVVDTINNAIESTDPASTLRAQVNSSGYGFSFVNGSNLTIASVGEGDTTAEELGIDFNSVTGTATGESLMADLNSVRVSTLAGANGTGINGATDDPTADLGEFTVRVNGATDFTIDLSALNGLDSLDDAIDYMNYQAQDVHGLDLTFRVNNARNGIAVQNTGTDSYEFLASGGTTTASDFGLESKTVGAGATVNAGDLDRRYISRATRLDQLNNGNGVYAGSFRITDSDGLSAQVSMSGLATVGDLVDRINGFSLNVQAAVNDTGDGIVLREATDNGSVSNIKIEEIAGGTTAKGLGLLGAGTGGETGLSVLNGSFERVINIDTDDTLRDVMYKITDSGANVETSIISDGSSYAPYRLVVNSTDSGGIGDFILDTELDAFNFKKAADGQDSVLLYGTGSATSSPLLLTSATNTNANAVLGLQIEMKQASDSFVTLNVTEDKEQATEAVQSLVDAFNTLHDLIGELDTYDEENETPGILFADSETRNVMNTIGDLFFTTVEGVDGGLMSFYDIGVNFNRDGNLELDSSKLSEQMRDNFAAVRELMTQMTDVARQDLSSGATATDAPGNNTSVSGLINGNTDSNDFGEGNGYQSLNEIAAGGTGVTINFGRTRTLSRMTLNHIDSDIMPASQYALRDFVVEYLDASTGNWEELRNVKGNRASHTYLGFAEPTGVDALRITATKSNAKDNRFRLVEVEAFEDSGIASKMEQAMDRVMDSQTGFFARQQDMLLDKIDDIDTSLDDLEQRMEGIELNYIRQFTAMETALARLQSQGDFFTQQMDALSNSKK